MNNAVVQSKCVAIVALKMVSWRQYSVNLEVQLMHMCLDRLLLIRGLKGGGRSIEGIVLLGTRSRKQ